MNACEKMQITKMNLRPNHIYTIEALIRMTLQELRNKRKAERPVSEYKQLKSGKWASIHRTSAGSIYDIDLLNGWFD